LHLLPIKIRLQHSAEFRLRFLSLRTAGVPFGSYCFRAVLLRFVTRIMRAGIDAIPFVPNAVFERSNTVSQAFADFWQFLWPENEDCDDEDYDQVHRLK
jgi:hypothetical protein